MFVLMFNLAQGPVPMNECIHVYAYHHLCRRYTHAEVGPSVHYIVSKVLSNRACISYLVLGERHSGISDDNAGGGANSVDGTSTRHGGGGGSALNTSRSTATTVSLISASATGGGGTSGGGGGGSGGGGGGGSGKELTRKKGCAWTRLVLGALGHCNTTAAQLARAGSVARPVLAKVQRRLFKSAMRRRAPPPQQQQQQYQQQQQQQQLQQQRLGTPNTRNDNNISATATPAASRPTTSVGGRGHGIRLDLTTAPPINHQLARQDDPDLKLLPNTSGFSFGENGYVFLLVLVSMAQVSWLGGGWWLAVVGWLLGGLVGWLVGWLVGPSVCPSRLVLSSHTHYISSAACCFSLAASPHTFLLLLLFFKTTNRGESSSQHVKPCRSRGPDYFELTSSSSSLRIRTSSSPY